MRLASLLLAAVAASNFLTAMSSSLAGEASTGWGFDVSGMDLTVAPGNDFFLYANGSWEQRTQIPDDRSVVGLFYDLRNSEADGRIRTILDGLSAGKTQSGKLRTFYDAYLDEKTIESCGSAPLLADIDRVRTTENHDDLATLMGQAEAGFGAAIFEIVFSSDADHSDRYAVNIGQSGLGLPDRDYYLQPQFAGQLAAYRDYAARLLKLIDWPDAETKANEIVAFETRIADVSWTGEAARDPVKTHNPLSAAQLQKKIPHFAWDRFLSGAGLAGVKRLNATTLSSLSPIAAIYSSTPIATLKAWLAFRTADTAAPYLPDIFVQAQFDFRSYRLAGQAAPLPRWRRGIRLLSDSMGSALGELYVARYSSPGGEAAMADLVHNLRIALQAHIERASWMARSTRQEALRKLAHLEVQIGHPARWIDYEGLAILPGDLYGNVARARSFDWHRRVAQLSGPWNKSDWRFWPQYATAYTENRQLIFTAAMLQPPFFDPKADPAVNYGAIGAVIGHELSHQFDDQGRHEDADGRERDWWAPADAQHFQEQAERLSAQYSAMEPLPGLHIKGDRTLGENIADLGGVEIALTAYHASLHAQPAPVIDGFSGDQRFFLAWAQGWREKDRDDRLRQMIASDVHSPATARVNGVVRNIDAWYEAWHIQPDEKLALPPNERVRIW